MLDPRLKLIAVSKSMRNREKTRFLLVNLIGLPLVFLVAFLAPTKLLFVRICHHYCNITVTKRIIAPLLRTRRRRETSRSIDPDVYRPKSAFSRLLLAVPLIVLRSLSRMPKYSYRKVQQNEDGGLEMGTPSKAATRVYDEAEFDVSDTI